MKITCTGLHHVSESITDPKSRVKYMLPGEVASLNMPKKYVEESDLEVKSPDRQKVICPIFYDCGGCDLLHVFYDAQLRLKQEHIQHLYKDLNYRKAIPIIKNDEPLYYRHKVVLSATTHKLKLRLGLYREKTKEVIPFLNCFLHDKLINQVLSTLETILNQYKIPAYDIDSGKGILKHILIRKSYHENKLMVVLVTQGNLLPNAKKMVQDVLKKHPEIETVVQNIHHKKTHLVLLEEEKILYGKGFIFDQIHDYKFRLSARSFYQINPLQMIKLYDKALDLLNIQPNEIIMDTYSGIGTISILAAKKAKEVIAIETNQKSHLDAMQNKKDNAITNITFVNDDVERYMMQYRGKIDGLIMDPTRDGASENFLKAVLQLKPKKIVYISCEPLTQTRDLKILSKSYVIKDVVGCDMFSQTVHVESIVLLSLKTA